MKLNLSNITSGYGAVAALNANFDAIETAVEKTLSRDGTTPNEMLANLDMNGNDILNANAVDVSSLTINGTPVQPSTGVTVAQAFQSYTFTATLGQTSFSVSPYTPYVASVQVEVNGLSLPPADISVSGTNVVIPACSAGDEVVIRRYTDAPSPFPVASDITFNQSGTVQTRSVQSKLRDVVSVKDFGAVGDGLADDTLAIQNALNAAIGVGLTIYMPKGTYKTTSTLNWPTDWPVALVGDGVESTHINYTGASTAISMYDAGASTKYIKSSLENLRLSGNGSTSTNGINIRQGYAIALRNVRVYNFQVGVRIEQTWSAILDFVRIDSCSQVGLELHNEANNVACYCCEFLDNAKGIYTAGARSVLFSECTIEANTQYGAYITANTTDGQSESIVFHGCYIEANTTNDIRVIVDSGATSPQSVIVRDCYFVCMASKATIAVRADQADHVVIDGCDFSTGTATYAYSLYISDSGTVDKIRFGKNRDASTNGVYRGTGTSYSDATKLEARAWGRFTVSGGAIATTNTFGVANITYIGTGAYEVTLRDAMPGTNYAVIASAENGASFVAMLCSPGQPISTTVFRINTASTSAAAAEARTVNFSVFA